MVNDTDDANDDDDNKMVTKLTMIKLMMKRMKKKLTKDSGIKVLIFTIDSENNTKILRQK